MVRLDKKVLKQVSDIRKEIQELDRAADRVKKKIDALKKDEVCDTVMGSRADLTIGPITVRGHPQKEYGKKINDLQKKKTLMEKKKTELLQLELQAELYIQSIENNSGLRRILRLRYMEELSWQQVAARMGPRYSAESCRKKVERFMSDRETGQ